MEVEVAPGRLSDTKMDMKEEPLECCDVPMDVECPELGCHMNMMMCTQCVFTPAFDLSAYHRLDYLNFQPYPFEVITLPLMVDCRPASGVPAPVAAEPAAPPATVPSPADNQPPLSAPQGVGEAGTAPAARASTPAAANTLTTYTGAGMGGGYAPLPPYTVFGGAGGPVGGMKGGMMMCAPPPMPSPHHVPPNINTNVQRSIQPNGSDLPMNDIPTLRYFFNLGLEYLWGMYPPPPQLMAPPMPPPPLAHPPPRYYSPVNDIAQEMQQNLTLHERPPLSHNGDQKVSKPAQGPGQDKPPNSQAKGNGQRPPLGPRFKRGNGDVTHGNHNHSGQQKNNNFYNNKGGMNNRRNSHTESRGHPGIGYGGSIEPECGAVEAAMYSVPYVPYPPPLYHYYPVDTDPGMMSVVAGVGYMGYMGEELEHYPAPAPLLPAYYQHYQPAPPHHAPPHHQEHK